MKTFFLFCKTIKWNDLKHQCNNNKGNKRKQNTHKNGFLFHCNISTDSPFLDAWILAGKSYTVSCPSHQWCVLHTWSLQKENTSPPTAPAYTIIDLVCTHISLCQNNNAGSINSWMHLDGWRLLLFNSNQTGIFYFFFVVVRIISQWFYFFSNIPTPFKNSSSSYMISYQLSS